ncbi:MAG: hypothetical protein HYZ28_11735 [Myxococcales bacterium]|nr:hypothetical protein [Myxococcales bacterium]
MRRWLLAGLLPALLGGCPPPPPPALDGGGPPPCESRADCEPGFICTEEKVCDACESSGQCRLKEQCSPTSLLCELRGGWGDACATHEQCLAGQWCRQGLCLDRSEVSLCPGGQKSECPTGMRCNAINLVCEEDLGCAEAADCGPGEVCNTGSHACVPRCTVDTQSQVCLGGERCVNELCVQCASDAECGVGLVCDAAGKCSSAQRCYQDRDCKVPLVCHLQTGACLEKQPPCVSDENCAPEQRCDVGSGKCVPRACQPDRYEPNNDYSSAFGISASKYVGLTLCPQDVDYFSITLSRGDQLGVNVDADPFAENTFSAVVKDATGRTLAAGKLLTSYVASASQKYFVVVSTTDLYQPYDVTFLLSRGTPCDDDGYEPNDLASQATPVNAATTLEGAICPQDQDHFAVAVPAQKGVRVSLVNYDASKGLLRLCLMDGATQLGCNDDPAPEVSASSSQAGGKSLTARVVGSTDRVANSYTLKVEFL